MQNAAVKEGGGHAKEKNEVWPDLMKTVFRGIDSWDRGPDHARLHKEIQKTPTKSSKTVETAHGAKRTKADLHKKPHFVVRGRKSALWRSYS